MANDSILSALSNEFRKASPDHLRALIELHEAQATVPYIVHYCPDRIGGLAELQVIAILDRYRELASMWSRKRQILDAMETNGILTDELKQKVEASLDRWELEDLFLPYRGRRRSKAITAKERGLEPLADLLWNQQGEQPLEELVAPFIDPEKKVENADEAFDGAVNIMSEWIALNPSARRTVRQFIWDTAKLESRLAPEREGQASAKYETYHNFSEPLRSIPSHRLLAIRRGVKERWLQFTITVDREAILARLREQFIINPEFPGKDVVDKAVVTAFDRLMWKTISSELLTSVNERADAEAIDIFCKNLRSLLLMPAAGRVPVLAIEAASKPEVRVAAIDADGTFVEAASIFPGPQDAKPEESAATLQALVEKHNPVAVVVGNGAGSRATDDFVRAFLKQTYPDPAVRKIARVVVNESGANIYAGSGIAKEELKDVDAPTRCAVTIGRRFQDPLAEMVKVDPRAVGVGQYQHDVDQRRLRDKLHGVVESCVNYIGVDLNTGSFSMLSYVSGFNRGTARRIVEHRQLHGPFASLAAMKEIPAVNESVFRQAAGFLRVKSDEPLENTLIHLDHYELVRKMAAELNSDVGTLLGDRELVKTIDADKYATGEIGPLAIRKILREIRNPAHDPRRRPEKAHLDDSVSSLDDLKDGMLLEGTVTNVTNFGAFVDIGVHQDGLVHVSELAANYVRDPNDAVKIGEVVRVKVLNIDHERHRISLSIKQAQPRGEQQPAQPKRRKAKGGRRPAAARPGQPGQPARPAGEGVDRRPITPDDIKKLMQRLATR